MKNKRIITVALVFLMLFGTACGKEPKGTKDFMELMENEDFQLSDCTGQYSEIDYMEEAWVAVSADGEYQVEFYKLDTSDNATAFFNENYAILSAYESDSSSKAKSSTKKSQYYEVTGEDGFYCISRIEDTVFYAVVKEEYKNEVKDLKKQLGY